MSTYYVNRDKIYTDTTKSYLLHRERELNQLIARITYSVKNGPEFHEYRIRYHSRLGSQLVICSVTVAWWTVSSSSLLVVVDCIYIQMRSLFVSNVGKMGSYFTSKTSRYIYFESQLCFVSNGIYMVFPWSKFKWNKYSITK